MANKDVKTVPAGKNDNFKIDVMDINNIVEFDEMSKKYKKTLKVNNSKQVEGALSTELEQGMSIKADSNENVIMNFQERKAKIKARKDNNEKVKSFEEKQKESDQQVI